MKLTKVEQINFLPIKKMTKLMKYAGIGAAAITGLFAGFSAFAAGEIVVLPDTALADLTGNAGQILSDVWVLIALAIGIPLGFYIIKKVIALIPKK